MVTVAHLMARRLITVPAGTSVLEAAKIMRDRQIGSVFVEQGQRIVGIVTEPDIVRNVVGRDQTASQVPIDAIMSTPVLGIDQGRPITEAADLMARYQTRHLAVLEAGAIVGVLSVRDLLPPVAVDEF